MTTNEAKEIITRFRLLITNLMKGKWNRSEINQLLPQIKTIVYYLGTNKKMDIAPPAMIGGYMLRNVNPLDMIFNAPYGLQYEIHSCIVDMMDESLGVFNSQPNIIEEIEERNSRKKEEKEGFSIKESNKVFIVHGRDNELKETVARFVEKLGLEAIILHEQVNEGNTIIEKFEKNTNVGFAIVLMTPDDIGGLDAQNLKERARQNVILELGYFIGKLGRDCVAALVKGNIEIPSDFAGVVYTGVDPAGFWKIAVAKEMKACGYNVDLNKL